MALSIPPPTSAAVSKSMRGNRATDTTPELLLRRSLRDAGVPGYRLQWKTPAGRVDVAYPGLKIAVYVHGCFWHRCPVCSPPLPKSNTQYWEPKFASNVARDRRKIAELEAAGWIVFVAWECQIRRESTAVAEAIADVLLAAKLETRHAR